MHLHNMTNGKIQQQHNTVIETHNNNKQFQYIYCTYNNIHYVLIYNIYNEKSLLQHHICFIELRVKTRIYFECHTTVFIYIYVNQCVF